MLLNFQIAIFMGIMLDLALTANDTPFVMEFIQNNSTCRIPDVHHWNFKKFYKPKSYISCNTEHRLVNLEKIEGRYYAVVDQKAVSYYADSSVEISCWISNITRGAMSELPDNEIRESKAIPFESQTQAEINKDVVKIKCYKVERNSATVVYENVFGSYVPFGIIDRKPLPVRDPFSVLLVVIDSLSKYNLIRTMPQTYEYLTKNDYKLLHGYCQLDRVALPNIIPLLTGYSMNYASAKFGNPLDTFFDVYDFAWYDFEQHSYITAFAEDFARANTFNRQYKGFWSKPTDFYFRPLSLATELMNVTYLDGMPHCTGPENAAERILNLATEFMVAFNSTPYFGLFWLNTFSHDDYNAPGRMDEKLLEFFKSTEPYNQRTIIFFLSDHGYGKNPIDEDPLGLYESISPFNFVYLPSKFKKKYPELTERFERNSLNLVSPYDIYATLQDILVLSDTEYSPKQPKSCPTCKSIFRELPRSRTCKDAGVDEDWCICWKDGTLRSPTMEDEGDNGPAPIGRDDEDDDNAKVPKGRSSGSYEKPLHFLTFCLYFLLCTVH